MGVVAKPRHRGLMKKKKKEQDLTEMKKAPWDFGIRPPDTTVADIISGTCAEIWPDRACCDPLGA